MIDLRDRTEYLLTIIERRGGGAGGGRFSPGENTPRALINTSGEDGWEGEGKGGRGEGGGRGAGVYSQDCNDLSHSPMTSIDLSENRGEGGGGEGGGGGGGVGGAVNSQDSHSLITSIDLSEKSLDALVMQHTYAHEYSAQRVVVRGLVLRKDGAVKPYNGINGEYQRSEKTFNGRAVSR